MIRILCMKNRKLLGLVFLCSLFIGLRTYYYVNQLDNTAKTFTHQLVKVQSDSVKVDGNFLKLIGKIKGKKYLVYYSLKSPEKKKRWTCRELPNVLLIDGESEAFDSARNLNGFDEKKYYQSLGISQIIQVESLKPSRQKQLTLSGLHLLLKRGRLIRESRLAILSAVGLCLIFLTGGSFSTIRAVLSFLIAFACLTFDISLSKLDQWSLMLFLLVSCFPLVFWSIGAQLSLYFALLLLYVSDARLKTWQQILLFSILSLPMLIYSFSEWKIIGGLFTLLLFPIFEWVILPGCLLLFLGCFLPMPSFFSLLLDTSFQLLERFLAFAAFPNLIIGRPTFLILLALLFLVFSMIDHLKYRQKFYWQLAAAILLLVPISFSANGMVAFVDVGQGDSIFIKLPFKQETFLIDTGGRLKFKQKKGQARQQKQPSDYNLLPFLKSLGCSRIDHLLITHNDADHMGELVHVLDEIKVKHLYLAKGSHMEIRNLLEPIRGTTIHLVKTGDMIGEHLRLRVLSPEASQGENNDSLVAYFSLNQQRFLLTGDLEIAGEEKLIENYPQLKTDFLKIGHHGSNTSTGEELLKKTRPKYAIISAGKNNRYGHPTEETLAKLKKHQIKVFRTDQQGMIYYQWSVLTNRGEIKLLIDFLD